MTWTSSQPVATPEQFDAHYRGELHDHHTDDVLSLAGDLTGLRVLDLGGGTLLARRVACARKYTLVDFSAEACRQVTGENVETHQCEALRFLRGNREWFDLMLCFGLLEYLPAGAIDDVFRLAPAPVLCLGTATAEAYLQYPGRVTAYSGEEVVEAAKRHSWRDVRRLPMPSHVWGRWER